MLGGGVEEMAGTAVTVVADDQEQGGANRGPGRGRRRVGPTAVEAVDEAAG